MSRRIFFAHLPPDMRSALDQELHACLTPLGVRVECIHDGISSVLEEPRDNLFAAARAALKEGPIDALILGGAGVVEELSAVELGMLLRCQVFVLLTTNDEWTGHRLERLKGIRVYALGERALLVSALVDFLVNDFPPAQPARRIFLCHLDPTVREMLALRLEDTLAAHKVTLLHDEATSVLDAQKERLFATAHRITREGPVDLVIMGVNNDVADLAVTYLHELFACPVFVIMSIVDEAAERRLRSAGAKEVFHAPHIEPIFQWVREHLQTLDNSS